MRNNLQSLFLKDAFPALWNYNNVKNEVTGLDVCGRGTCPHEQMSMHTYARLYIFTWKPEINVQMSSSVTIHLMF